MKLSEPAGRRISRGTSTNSRNASAIKIRTRSISLLPLLLLSGLLTTEDAAAQDAGAAAAVPPILYFPDANSRATYFTIHDVHEAWAVTKGEGVKLGILDHSFGFGVHADLYAGGETFQTDRWRESFDTVSHHGYWMARTLHELAPAAESSRSARIRPMRAPRWTPWSARSIGPSRTAWTCSRTRLRAFRPSSARVSTRRSTKRTGSGSRPRSSTTRTPATSCPAGSGHAAFVAMVKSADPALRPDELRRILVETSHSLEFEGRRAAHVVDVGAAVAAAQALKGR